MVTRKHAEWLVLVFLMCLIAIVFQQIHTSMAEQGIASGSPYDNAAAYPRAVAILMAVLLGVSLIIRWVRPAPAAEAGLPLAQLWRPAALLLIFAGYLLALGWLGYLLATPPMVMAVMLLSGLRNPIEIVATGVIVSFALAFFFEVFLKIVLPGGIWQLNIPW